MVEAGCRIHDGLIVTYALCIPTSPNTERTRRSCEFRKNSVSLSSAPIVDKLYEETGSFDKQMKWSSRSVILQGLFEMH